MGGDLTCSMTRTRTVTWQDPALGAEAAASLPGIEWLRAMARGDAPPPPLAMLLGFSLAEIAEGEVTVTCEPAEFHYNPLGVVHGGLAAALFDSALGCAVQSVLPPASAAPTMQLQINYIRPITVATGKLTCTGRVIHTGRRLALAEGRLTDAAGTLHAYATGSFVVRKIDERRDG